MEERNDWTAQILGVSRTASKGVHYVLREMLSFYLTAKFLHRYEEKGATARAITYYSEMIVQCLHEDQSLRVEIADISMELRLSRFVGEDLSSLFSNITSLQNARRNNHRHADELRCWQVRVNANYHQQMNLLVQHARLVDPKFTHLDHEKLTELIEGEAFASGIPEIGIDISDETVFKIAPKLLDDHRKYHEEITKEKSHEDSEKDYFSIEICLFLKAELMKGNLDRQLPPDTDKKILEKTMKKYYDKGNLMR